MVNKLDTIPDEEFKQIIQNSCCTADVLRNLGYSVKGNSWAYKIVDEKMQKLNITFGKKFTNSYTGKHAAIPMPQVLTEDSSYCRTKLKARLLAEGIKEYKCECCGLTEWNGKPITLQLHHINGINNDNRLSNLTLLCPNCHSQTENFGTKGKGLFIKRKAEELPLEDKEKIMNTVREVGIVQARKVLPYRNSLINRVVRSNKDFIVMITPEGEEKVFNTTYETSEYLFRHFSIGKAPQSSRSGINKCLAGKQSSIRGFKFFRRSLAE